MSRRESILAAIEKIPEIPTTASRVMQLLGDPEFDMDDLIRAVEMDQAATANLLRMANSAYFGRGASVGTVQEAVVRMGAQRVGQLLMVASTGPVAARPLKGYDLDPGMLWRHSLAVAITTDLIAKETQSRTPPYTFTAGLLHDLGKIVMDVFVEADAEVVKTLCYTDNLSFDMAERQHFGIDHPEIGAVLLKNWNLPAPLVEAVRWHHKPDGATETSPAVDAVHCANQIVIAAEVGTGIDSASYKLDPSAAKRLRIDDENQQIIAVRLGEELAALEEVFSLAAQA